MPWRWQTRSGNYSEVNKSSINLLFVAYLFGICWYFEIFYIPSSRALVKGEACPWVAAKNRLINRVGINSLKVARFRFDKLCRDYLQLCTPLLLMFIQVLFPGIVKPKILNFDSVITSIRNFCLFWKPNSEMFLCHETSKSDVGVS